MTCCLKGFKFVLLVVNMVNFVVGWLLLSLGIFMVTTTKDYSAIVVYFEGPELVTKISVASFLFITVGCVVALVSFIGCCAVCRGSKWMFYTYALLTSVFVIVEITGGVYILVYDDPTLKVLRPDLQMSSQTYGNPGFEKSTLGWNKIQSQFKCCGIEGPRDWEGTTFQKGNSTTAPDSCCKIEFHNCGAGQLIPSYDELNSEGCFTKFHAFVTDHIKIVGYTAIGIAIFQIIVVVIAFYLGKELPDTSRYSRYF